MFTEQQQQAAVAAAPLHHHHMQEDLAEAEPMQQHSKQQEG